MKQESNDIEQTTIKEYDHESDLVNIKLIEQHSRWNTIVLKFKIFLLIIHKMILNQWHKIPKHKITHALIKSPKITSINSILWTENHTVGDHILTAGKIQNLRMAAQSLHGLEVPAHSIFSFWMHVPRPHMSKGYVYGREIKQGCIVPSVAGGLCQISNALYELARKVNMEIIERHRHSHQITANNLDADATIKWNYIDLRMRAPFRWGIDLRFTDIHMIMSIKSDDYRSPNEFIVLTPSTNTYTHHTVSQSLPLPSMLREIRDCYSCNESKCAQFKKHQNDLQLKISHKSTSITLVLDEPWHEWIDYVHSYYNKLTHLNHDLSFTILTPTSTSFPVLGHRYGWPINLDRDKKHHIIQNFHLLTIKRWGLIKYHQFCKHNVFASRLDIQRLVAVHMAARIPIESTHLVISQTLLPYLYEAGYCAGRTFDVLLTRHPIALLQHRLNHVLEQYPQSPTLNDFRASYHLEDAEQNALLLAQKIITPHTELAQLYPHKTQIIPWYIPIMSNTSISNVHQKSLHSSLTPPPTPDRSNHIPKYFLFPAALLARKGAYEIKKIIEELDLPLMISSTAVEDDTLFQNQKFRIFNDQWHQIKAVIYPTYIEHQPRLLLKALSVRIPVITTKACGIPAHPLLHYIDFTDNTALKDKIHTLN